ncbi:MAG: isoleucine--tRNA ligase, partial [Nitrososphaerota archaeon]
RLRISSKKDLERIGLEKFVEEANRVIDYYIAHWRGASERLGLWLDYDSAYETRKNEYMEHVWALLKQAYEMGDLVESLRVVPTCPRCETPLSQHELAQGYEEIQDPSIYVKFPTYDPSRYILIWTTTPWTIPGNEGVAIDEEGKYVEVRVGSERWIIAEAALPRLIPELGIQHYSVVKTYDGRQLIGTPYNHPLVGEVPHHKGHGHHIIAGRAISMEEGTGCVHIAPAHGPEDFELGRENGLPVFCPVSEQGYFTSVGGKYAGKSVEDVSREVINDLRSKGLLAKEGEILHNYPLCWRCGTRLIYLASVQWFLKVDRIKRTMVEGNRSVKWWPEWAGRNRFGEWLENADDWCISRTKVWGTPLPVWRCEACGAVKVVGSRKELEDALEKSGKEDLHRPWIDMYVFQCRSCGGKMRRLPYVLDTWLDSGVAHMASVNSVYEPSLFERLFPYDFVTEAIDQTRGWFYTLMFTSTLLFGRPPYKSVLNQGHVLDEFGKKMSKSRGNVIWAVDAFNQYGVDPLRIYLVHKAEPWSTINFVPSEVVQVREHLNILWNVFSFAETYFAIDLFKPEKHSPRDYLDALRPEDRWILTRVNRVVENASHHLEEMEINSACREVLSLVVEDLSRTYVRAIRRRAWGEDVTRDKLAAYSCLHYALRRVLLLLAPFAPYITETLFESIRQPGDPESIHLTDWPQVEEDLMWDTIEEYMDVVKDVLKAILAARQRAGRRLRSPVSRIVVVPKTEIAKEALNYFTEYLEASSNCKLLEVADVGDGPPEIVQEFELNLRLLGPRLGSSLTPLIETLRKTGSDPLRRAYGEGVAEVVLADGSRVSLTRDEVLVKTKVPEKYSVGESQHAAVYVDISVAEDLVTLSLVREVIRRIQVMRKEAGLNVLDRIECVVATGPEIAKALMAEAEYIEEETRSRLVVAELGSGRGGGFHWREWKIAGVDTVIGIR